MTEDLLALNQAADSKNKVKNDRNSNQLSEST